MVKRSCALVYHFASFLLILKVLRLNLIWMQALFIQLRSLLVLNLNVNEMLQFQFCYVIWSLMMFASHFWVYFKKANKKSVENFELWFKNVKICVEPEKCVIFKILTKLKAQEFAWIFLGIFSWLINDWYECTMYVLYLSSPVIQFNWIDIQWVADDWY